MSKYGLTTTIVHHEQQQAIEHNAVHKPIHVSCQYAFANANELVTAFQGTGGFTYSRQGTPTTSVLEDLINTLEEGIGTISFSSGMAALSAVFYSLLRQGDHLICSKFIFGNTKSLLTQLAHLGVEITFVDPCNAQEISAAIQDNSRMLFTETIANPGTQVAALQEMGQLCKAHGLVYVIDNTMTTPMLLKGKDVQADIVMHSLSKYICGHANALGGSLTVTGLYDWSRYPNIYDDYKKGDVYHWGLLQLRKKGLRDVGACMSSDAAHRILMGAETFPIRMQRYCSTAQQLAEFLQNQAGINKVTYPALSSHPEHQRCQDLFGGNGGALLAIELSDDVDCLAFLDELKLVVLATHLGDNRTLALPVARTIYHEMGPQKRAEMGIVDGLLRVSVGLEDPQDLIDDFANALKKLA
ncbi:cystathionine gamma-synthase family protein [Brackiella oedipodis]|uniref:cystathionine gamma-synthase family protein n=1 Tax=Brackiella oedipodis TaxID=124225 RepID=UPI00049038B6|nr:cystathionine gamma-synthase family protein [Brackiella oedipodis]